MLPLREYYDAKEAPNDHQSQVHPYKIITEIDYDSLEFSPDAPEPLPDGMYQYPVFEQVYHILGSHLDTLGDPASIFRSSNTFICYNPDNLNVRVGPDYYVAFDVDALAIKRRRLYLPWEVGKPPDFVLEVGSPSTGHEDTGAQAGHLCWHRGAGILAL